MSKYVEDLEKQNEELSNLLAHSQKEVEDMVEMLRGTATYSILLFMRVNGHLIGVPWTDGVQFSSSLIACKFLKKNWTKYHKDFKKRFEVDGFEFKYFCVDTHHILSKHTQHPVYLGSQWAFETQKELDDTIKILKSIAKSNEEKN
jgi:hypothetical protein